MVRILLLVAWSVALMVVVPSGATQQTLHICEAQLTEVVVGKLMQEWN